MARNSDFLNTLPSEYKDDFCDANAIPSHKVNLLKDILQTSLVRLISLLPKK